MLRFVALGFGLLAPIAASASFATGNDLLERCAKPSDEPICIGYVMGIADAMQEENVLFGWRACLRQQVSGDQIKDVALHYIRAHAEARDADAASLVANALAEAFPCR